jgi:hypothetical protein
MQPRIDRSVVLPLPDGPIQHRQFAAVERHADVLQRLHPRGPAAKNLADLRGLDDGLDHWVSTIAGSTQTTRTIDAIAEAMHITTVRRKSAIIRLGAITICSALLAVKWTRVAPINAAMANPMTALISA